MKLFFRILFLPLFLSLFWIMKALSFTLEWNCLKGIIKLFSSEWMSARERENWVLCGWTRICLLVIYPSTWRYGGVESWCGLPSSILKVFSGWSWAATSASCQYPWAACEARSPQGDSLLHSRSPPDDSNVC